MASCSCGTGDKSKYTDVEALLNDSNKRKEMAELTHIEKELFVKGDEYSMLRFLHCADPEAFVKAFSKYDELDLDNGFSDEDIKILADMWKSGRAEEIGMDVKQTLKDMRVSKKKLATCSVKFV